MPVLMLLGVAVRRMILIIASLEESKDARPIR